MEYKTIIVEEKDLIGRITFNKPPLNILNIEMMKEINQALQSFKKRNLKVIIIKANGKARPSLSAITPGCEHIAEKLSKSYHTLLSSASN